MILRRCLLPSVILVPLFVSGCLDVEYVPTDTGDARDTAEDAADVPDISQDTAALDTRDVATDSTPSDTADTADSCQPTNNGREICDDVDNDCDGETDERTNCLFVVKLPETHQARAVSVDMKGEYAYVAGNVPESKSAPKGQTDIFVSKFDMSGQEKWTETLRSPGEDNLNDIEMLSGMVTLVGRTGGDLHGASKNTAGEDGFIATLSSQGMDAKVGYLGTKDSGDIPDVDSDEILATVGNHSPMNGNVFGSMTVFDPNNLSIAWSKDKKLQGSQLKYRRVSNTGSRIWVLSQTQPMEKFHFHLTLYDGLDETEKSTKMDVVSTSYYEEIGFDADKNGPVICGSTNSNIGGPNAGAWDAFVVKFDGNMSRSWSRQLGSQKTERCIDVRAHRQGFFVSGYTTGKLKNSSALGRADAFLARYDRTANLSWVRTLGGPGSDQPRSFSIADDKAIRCLLAESDGPFEGLEAPSSVDQKALICMDLNPAGK